MTSTKNQLKARAMTMMVQGAVGAYLESAGKHSDDNMMAALQLAHERFDDWMEPAKQSILRARAAGLTKVDPRFETEVLNCAVTGLALYAAAQIAGEPPAKDEAKPEEAAAVH